MSSFDWKKNIGDPVKDGLVINHRGCWNILRFKGSKRKTTESISGRYGYTKTYWWDLWRHLGERF